MMQTIRHYAKYVAAVAAFYGIAFGIANSRSDWGSTAFAWAFQPIRETIDEGSTWLLLIAMALGAIIIGLLLGWAFNDFYFRPRLRRHRREHQ